MIDRGGIVEFIHQLNVAADQLDDPVRKAAPALRYEPTGAPTSERRSVGRGTRRHQAGAG
jgi:hypothetical protein